MQSGTGEPKGTETPSLWQMPSLDEVAESAARKWQPGRIPGFRQVGDEHRKRNKARRKQSEASRKRNRK